MTGQGFSEKLNLSGQVALITEGGIGLGQAYSRALASAGATVAVIARSKEQLDGTVEMIIDEGGHAIAIQADVTDQVAIEQTVVTDWKS